MKRSLRTLVLILSTFVAFPATAELVARDQVGNYVALKKDQCQASQWLQKDWKQAEMFYDGRKYRACWRLSGTEVYILGAAGDVSIVPAYAFKEETGT